MKRAMYLAIAGLLAVACKRSAPGTHGRDEVGTTVDRAGRALDNVGSSAVHAVDSAGHAVVYGTRELGQTMSGTQGNPQAEAISQRERQRMDQQAEEARQRMHAAGEAITGRGGGPQPR